MIAARFQFVLLILTPLLLSTFAKYFAPRVLPVFLRSPELVGVRPPELTGVRYQGGIAGMGNWHTPPNISTNVPKIGIVRMGIDLV